MHKGWLIGSVIVFALSLACIGTTVVEMIQGKYGMNSLDFWGAVIFHPVTAIVAAFLLVKASRAKQETLGREE